MRTLYDIIAKAETQDLQTEVQIRLNAGWLLIGGPFVNNSNKMCQAMTRTLTAQESALTSGAVLKNNDGSLEFGVPGDATA